MRSARCLRPLLTAVILALGATSLSAQDSRGRRGGPPDREALMERIRARMAAMTKERLGLTDAESEALSEVVRQFDGRRAELARSDFELRHKVGSLDGDDIGDDEAAALLEEMIALRRSEAELFEEELSALLEVLTPSQVIELQALREDMGRRIRSLRRGDDRDGRRPGENDGRRRRGRGGDGGGDVGGGAGLSVGWGAPA